MTVPAGTVCPVISTCAALCTCVATEVGALLTTSGSHTEIPLGTFVTSPLLNTARNEIAPAAVSVTLAEFTVAEETPLAIDTVCGVAVPVQSIVPYRLNVTVLDA